MTSCLNALLSEFGQMENGMIFMCDINCCSLVVLIVCLILVSVFLLFLIGAVLYILKTTNANLLKELFEHYYSFVLNDENDSIIFDYKANEIHIHIVKKDGKIISSEGSFGSE